MKKVAIVILNWNGEQMLRRFLPSVLQHSEDVADIVVADNASTDASLALLEKEFPTVRTIVLDRNYGFAEGYNRALNQVENEYYVLLNSDVEVTEGWLDTLVSFMDSHPEAAACQPKLLPSTTTRSSNMPVRVVATSTVMATRSVAADFSNRLRKTKDNTTMCAK